MPPTTYKTSTILVSMGRRMRVFKSIEEMPDGLKKRVTENMSGPNSRTLVVADRRGREYLLKALKRAGEASVEKRKKVYSDTLTRKCRKLSAWWVEIGLITMLGAACWALFRWN
jgi:hypothetical protein